MHTAGLESLYKYVPKEVLPEEYGGYAGPLDVIHGELNSPLLSVRQLNAINCSRTDNCMFVCSHLI
jgi:hypothetical protein